MSDYAVTISKRLEDKGFKPAQSWQSRSVIAVSENGKTYRTVISHDSVSAVFQIDGNIIKSGQKCDKLLVVTDDSDMPIQGRAVFIELKGKDINHAIDQLEAAINNQYFKPYPLEKDKTRARIVTGGCGPKSSSRMKLEDARIRFKRQYNIELRVLKNNQTDNTIILG